MTTEKTLVDLAVGDWVKRREAPRLESDPAYVPKCGKVKSLTPKQMDTTMGRFWRETGRAVGGRGTHIAPATEEDVTKWKAHEAASREKEAKWKAEEAAYDAREDVRLMRKIRSFVDDPNPDGDERVLALGVERLREIAKLMGLE